MGNVRYRLVLEDLIRRQAQAWFEQHHTSDVWRGFLIDIIDEARNAALAKEQAA